VQHLYTVEEGTPVSRHRQYGNGILTKLSSLVSFTIYDTLLFSAKSALYSLYPKLSSFYFSNGFVRYLVYVFYIYV
jgi:hypothetical protein